MISANIITLNEESNIGACIDSVAQVCNEVIVVDSGSEDATVDIAKEKGAKVVTQPYLGDGFQKNVANEHAGNRWVLSVDADERLSDELVHAIRNLELGATGHEAFAFRRKNMIGSRWVRHCGWYPDYCVRLYDKEKVGFKEVEQHSSIAAKDVGYIKADMIHYSFENIGELFSKPERNFSTRAAKVMYKKGKRANAWSPFVHGTNAFIRKYLFQHGFAGGVDGMTVSLSAAVNSYLKYAKLLEYQRDAKVLEAEDFEKIW
ncbi:glycosyltransferase family 2 protein [Billgrantia gudaonensis]|uniref:Glycosyltransferase involved in cell wall bisynthesis n=1 Tax=Billgrantia gudaonensis TaxID=376427 RepID=A0A1G8PJC6_9GAMM|nr:glycosyltransferase family 2 protein [Halomonas gudaonensis]SDI92594.1 Glycosyltransferase involved in cell wall bisynthesis [Halomonas gudaonensis]